MTRSITLTRSAQQPIAQGYHFTVEASGAVDMPNEVFRMKQRPLDPIAQTTTNEFTGICSPADLQDLPINAPIIPDPRFRVLFIDVTYYNIAFGDSIWEDIKFEVNDLVSSLNAGDILGNVEVITVVGD
jgi:hypothetical protein